MTQPSCAPDVPCDCPLCTALRKIEEEGFLLCNLFQLKNGRWQANLYSAEYNYEFGRADDPASALNAARLGRGGGVFPGKNEPTTWRPGQRPTPVGKRVDLAALLGKGDG